MGLGEDVQVVRQGKKDSIYIYGDYADMQLERLRQLRGLRVIYLEQTDATDAGMAFLRDVPDLRVFHLAFSVVGDDGIEALVSQPNIEDLLLLNTKVTDRGVATLQELPRLKTLGLYWASKRPCPFSDKALDAIAEMRSLEVLKISGEWYTKHAVECLRRRRPTLEIKKVSGSAANVFDGKRGEG